ncbi:MAG: alpha/beta fold hydrolase [Cyclobacteriaceae bacterium]
MESNYLEIGEGRLHYYKMGRGKDALLCFHGFGQHALHYVPFEAKSGGKYTIYTFDLFYHGKSHWPACEQALQPDALASALLALFRKENFKKVSICGYSMGGKMVLCLIPALAPYLEKVILIAPDGVKTNFWYNLATYPHWSRRIFRYIILHPRLFFNTAQLLKKIGLVDKGLVKFASGQMNSTRKRRQVYCTWMVFRKFRPDLEEVGRHIKSEQLMVYMFVGKYDRIIRTENMQRLLRWIPQQHQLKVLEAGHNTLINDVAALEEFPF